MGLVLVTMELVGVDKIFYEKMIPYLSEHLETLTYDELRSVHGIISQFEDDQKFVDVEIELRYQIDKYDSKGNLKPEFR